MFVIRERPKYVLSITGYTEEVYTTTSRERFIFVNFRQNQTMWKDSSTSSSIVKRKPFVDLTNISSENDEPLKSDDKYDVLNMLPTTCESNELHVAVDDDKHFQNVHPLLGWNKHDLETGILSYDSFMQLMDPSNELPLLNLLSEIGGIVDSNQCLFCVGDETDETRCSLGLDVYKTCGSCQV